MKRSLQVSAPLLAATALSVITGCREPQMQRCVDEQNRVVADNLCQNGANNVHQGAYGGFTPYYHYYYGGYGGYGLGTPVSGGSLSPAAGAYYATSTMRGGFGSSFGGGDSGGGHGSSGGS